MILEEKNAPALPSGQTAALSKRMIAELDGIRGLAILSVLLTHFFAYSMRGHAWTGLADRVRQVTTAGWLGVDLFFVLSGFLITGILIDSRNSANYFGQFYKRRALRILPLYLVILAVLAVFYQGSGPFVKISLLFCSNLAPIFGILVVSGGSALWSLSVEEHFYLVWPWVVRYAPSAMGMAAATALVCLMEPVIRGLSHGIVDDVYFYSWFRLDGMAWGAAMAIVVRSRRVGLAGAAGKLKVAAGLAAVALTGIAAAGGLGVLGRRHLVGAMVQFSLFQMLFAAVVLGSVTLADSGWTSCLRGGFLKMMGRYSYCLYMIHMPVADLFDHLDPWGMGPMAKWTFGDILLRTATVFPVCLGLAALSWKYFESRILRWR